MRFVVNYSNICYNNLRVQLLSKLSPKLVGAKIKQLRLSVNETQEEFAEHIDRTVETVSNIERGLVLPSLETVVNIFEHIGCNNEFTTLKKEENNEKCKP